jgi:ArsR family transcriptional regulator
LAISSLKSNAKTFKALSDETRLHILSLLREGEKCACVLLEELNISQPTLSHHMRVLVESGIVSPRREGKWIHYSINTSGSSNAVRLLQELTN